MVKPRGGVCDLDCAYCYYLDRVDLYPGSTFRMSDEVLESFTRSYLQGQLSPEVVFGWQGGEPTLMGLDFFRRAVELQRRYAPPGVRVSNTIQTNGVSLDDDWCAFFREHGFLVGISIDGPAPLHDAYRVDRGGQPTHARVMAGVERLKSHEVSFNVLATVHAANVPYPRKVYGHLRDDVGAAFVQFIPIVERARSGIATGVGAVSERSVSGRAYGEFLMAIFDEWVRRDVGRVFVQLFDVALSAWVGRPAGLCVFEETCGRALALEHNGDLYACDHFVDPEHRVGNVLRTELPVLVGSPGQRAFGRAKKEGLPRYCRECEVRFVCNGGCPKNRLLTTPEGESGLNWLCEGYRPFFNHVRPAMDYMADALRERRPPAAIMDLLARGSDAGLAGAYGAPPEMRA
ncbi:MAG: anaerobic sulfatase maturase [Gemmatimonadetes bacterium]|nr:anaerobic sulfatase maturase [Gemmatimonadota bacterium]